MEVIPNDQPNQQPPAMMPLPVPTSMMSMANQTAAVAAKVQEIMKQVAYAQKDGYNDFNKYHYVSEASLMKQVRQAMIEVGLIAFPSYHVTNVQVIESGKGFRNLTTVEASYRLVALDEDGHYLGEAYTTTVGQGMDTGDKAIYKAITGANKYLFLKLLLLETGDDPEATTDDGKPTNRKPTKVHSTLREKNKQTYKEELLQLQAELGFSNQAVTARLQELGYRRFNDMPVEKMAAFIQSFRS